MVTVKKSIIKTILRSCALLLVLLWLFLSFFREAEVTKGSPLQIYSAECGDRLFSIFSNAINSAKHEIYLAIYALSDDKVIKALNEACKRGVKIRVIYDQKTDPRGFAKLSSTIKKEPFSGSYLMHRKILVIDRERVYLGSANFTEASLRLYNNLVVGMHSKRLAHYIIEKNSPASSFEIGEQFVEFYTLPEEQEVALSQLLSLIDEAKESLVIGMFTWTYPPLTEAIIRAHHRAVKVVAILDKQASSGASRKAKQALVAAGIEVRVGDRNKLFHHKFALIDNTILATGSLNWTKAAFMRNQDCLLILHNLSTQNKKKLAKMCKIIRSATFIVE